MQTKHNKHKQATPRYTGSTGPNFS